MHDRMNLGGRTYQQLYDEAQKLISAHSDKWTNRNLSDPGVTILQSLAWLSAGLDETVETVTEAETARVFMLLGYPQGFARPARLILPLWLPEQERLLMGTPFLLRDMHFEVDQETELPAGGITQIRYEQDGESRDVSDLISAKAPLTLFVEKEAKAACFDIAFSHGIKSGERLRVYVEADSKFPRNKPEDDIPFARIVCKTWSKDGFADCKFHDSTACFTQNGSFEITVSDDMALHNGRYILRVTISRPEYDVSPVIRRIWGGHVSLTQKRTLSRCLSFDVDFNESLLFPLPFWGVETADLLVLGRDQSGAFRQYGRNNPDMPRSYSISEEKGLACICISCKNIPQQGKDAVRVLIRRQEALPILELGSVAGYDNQRFTPELQGAYPVEGAKLMMLQRLDGEDVYEDVTLSGGNILGHITPDGEIVIQRAATDGDNLLFFSELALTYAERGNLQMEALGEHRSGAFGGKNPGSAAESLSCMAEASKIPYIAVSLSDYKQLAVRTPGLSLEAATARKQENGGIQIAVKPYSERPCPTLRALQINAIAEYLEKHRLLNTKIEILSPKWIPVEIEIGVLVHPQAMSAKSQIADVIRRGIPWGDFEADISYGKIHALMDALDCVDSISYLAIRATGSAENQIWRGFADIYYLQELQIHCEMQV